MMQAATALLIEKQIQELIVQGNHDVYDTKLNTSSDYRVVPYVIYFYYISFLDDGLPSIQHYRKIDTSPIKLAEISNRIRDMALKIRDSDTSEFENLGKDFQDIKWYHKSYIVLFMDSPYWEVLKRVTDQGHEQAAIVFNTTKGGTPNHSFFDANDLTIYMSPDGKTEARSAIYFINHMKKTDFGDDLGYDQKGNKVPQSEPFYFDVYFEVSDDNGGAKTVFIIDPDGTNMGPPLGPP